MEMNSLTERLATDYGGMRAVAALCTRGGEEGRRERERVGMLATVSLLDLRSD